MVILLDWIYIAKLRDNVVIVIYDRFWLFDI
jgi:hypothetical protein